MSDKKPADTTMGAMNEKLYLTLDGEKIAESKPFLIKIRDACPVPGCKATCVKSKTKKRTWACPKCGFEFFL